MEANDLCLVLFNVILAGLVLVPVLALPIGALVRRLRGPARPEVELVSIPGIGVILVLREEPRAGRRCPVV